MILISLAEGGARVYVNPDHVVTVTVNERADSACLSFAGGGCVWAAAWRGSEYARYVAAEASALSHAIERAHATGPRSPRSAWIFDLLTRFSARVL